MKIKTSVLTGPALDWAVAKCEGWGLQRNPMGAQGGHGWWIWEETPSGKGGILIDKSVYMEIGPHTQPKTRNSGDRYSPSTDWAQGGPILDRELTSVNRVSDLENEQKWSARKAVYLPEVGAKIAEQYGPTPLSAICRCYVTSKLGDTVDIPEELL